MIPRVLATLPPPRIKLVPPPSQDIRTAALPGYPYRRPPRISVPQASQDIRTAGFPACCYAGFRARPCILFAKSIPTAALPGYPYRRLPSLLLRGLPSPPLPQHPTRPPPSQPATHPH
jgi:hypothetical protein